MKHASPETLQHLAPLLERLRSVPGLVERTPGTFYLRSMAFLHFHEDPAGVFADVKLNGPSFQRLPLQTAAHQASLVKAVSEAVAHLRKTKPVRGAVE
jgi:hypothetical protein